MARAAWRKPPGRLPPPKANDATIRRRVHTAMKLMGLYVQSLVGGALIGFSAALLLLLNGRIAGVSGIASGLLRTWDRDTVWRIAFTVGLVLGPLAFMLVAGHRAPMHLQASWAALLTGGLLVGFGSRLGSGCTSGHGVCGLARLSRRSFAAVTTFMLTAAATVFIVRHGL